MTGFPKLIPAFTAQLPISAPSQIGSASSGGLSHVSVLSEGGTLKSEPGYPVQLDAVFVHGADYIRSDPSGRHVRLEVSSLIKDKATGAFVRYNYTGTIPLTGPAGEVLGGKQDAGTTDFGEIFTHVSFETGDETLKEIQHKVYVGSGRFIVNEGQPLVVEYKISEISN